MHVNLLDYTSERKKVLAVVRVIDGQLSIEGDLPPRMKDTLAFEHAMATSDDQFLRKLPGVFSGSYTRAELVR